MSKGFTLIELLIVTTIIIFLAVVGLVVLNPIKQIKKSWDSKRKSDLSTTKKILEAFYNDKGRYPMPAEVCYDPAFNLANLTCHICGSSSSSPDFSPYLSELPCDPQSPASEYLYQVDNPSSPSWFRIYSELSLAEDNDIIALGCSFGCGPGYIYNYGVSSPNIDLETKPSCSTGDYWCLTNIGCKHCGALSDCQIGSCLSPLQLFTDYNCQNPCH